MKNYFLGIMCLSVAFVACKKDFLRRDTGVTQTKEDVFASAILAGQFADRSYTFMINDYGRLGAGGQPFRSSISEFTDETVSGSLEPAIVAMNTGNWLDPVNATEVTSTTNTSRGLPPWQKVYHGVRNTNVMLEQIDNVPWEKDPLRSKDLVKAEQFYLRAYYYFEFAKRWGGAVLFDKALELDATGNNPELDKPRNSFEETVAFILKDIDAAEQIFKSTTYPASGDIYTPQLGWNPSGGISANNGRADWGTVLALKSRVLLLAASPLWNSKNGNNPTGDVTKWRNAAEAAKAVMDLNRYSLHTDYRTLLEVNNSPEYIQIIVRGPRRANADNFFLQYVLSPGSGGTRGVFNPTQNHVDLYEMKYAVANDPRNGRRINDAGSGYTLTNPYANRDPRLASNILYNGYAWQSRTMETWYTPPATPNAVTVYGRDAGANTTQFTSTGYYCRKMWPANLVGGQTPTALLNYVVYRYGEILLNYAEAINEAGDPALAATAVDQIRARAGMPAVSATLVARGQVLNQANLRELIRNERAVELAFEDVRWWDILRWMKGPEIVAQPIYKMDVKKTSATTFVYTPTLMDQSFQRIFKAHMHLYPIPRAEVVKSTGKLVQNPGW